MMVGRKRSFPGWMGVVLALLAIELLGRAIYFQKNAFFPTAIQLMARSATDALLTRIAESRFKKDQLQQAEYAFYDPKHTGLMQEKATEYRQIFAELVKEVRMNGAEVMLLYVPFSKLIVSAAEVPSLQEFFNSLAKDFQVEYLDLTPELSKHELQDTTFLPFDRHFTRYGIAVMGRELHRHIQRVFPGYRSGFHIPQRPVRLGDLPPAMNIIDTKKKHMPYLLVTNRQGLRMDSELKFPAEKQRVLILGASIAFGPYLNNQDTLTEFLNRTFSDTEYVPAAIAGYSIPDKLSLYRQRAKYIEADIVVLQVSDSDLEGLLFYKRNSFARQRKDHKPSAQELEFWKTYVK